MTADTLTYGELFAGYIDGGLGMGVQSVLGGEMRWCAEFDKAPSRILATRYPHAPNLGDVTKVDWSKVEPVDVITGGSPCQDLSHAGKRLGMKAGTRSGLWASMCDAIEIIRPRLVVWENVRGSLSAQADGGTPNGHELCLCGGTDRRRGVRPSGRAAQDDVSGAGLGRDEPARAGSTDGPAGRVGRDVVSAAQSDRSVGGGVDVAPDGRAGSAPAGFGEAVASPEGAAGRPGAGGGVDSLGSGEAPEWAVPMDARSEGAVRGTQAGDARTEREGAACSCTECGGCLDARNCTLEPCAGCVGDGDDGPVLRALGRVLGDLAELGYDAWWYGLRAADVGAPHGRFRVFVFAVPAADAERGGRDGWARDPLGLEVRRAAAAGSGEVAGERLTLLPTPAVNDMGASYTPETWDAWTAKMQAAHGNGNGHGKSLAIEAQRLLPTPRSSDTNGAGAHGDGGLDLRTTVSLLPTPMVGSTSPASHGQISGQYRDAMAEALTRWGDYAPAIARWETVLGRPAPDPTEPGRNGSPRLSPRFVEWMMGLPAGWVTDVDISRNEQLKALGNGVVPQQAAAATAAFVADMAKGVAA